MFLGADTNLSQAVWPAADRIRNVILRGQCGKGQISPRLTLIRF